MKIIILIQLLDLFIFDMSGSKRCRSKEKTKTNDDVDDEPPKKRQKKSQSSTNSNAEDDDEESKVDENESITNENVSLDKIERLLAFDPNDARFSCRYEVYQQFELIAQALFTHIVLVLKTGKSQDTKNTTKSKSKSTTGKTLSFYLLYC